MGRPRQQVLGLMKDATWAPSHKKVLRWLVRKPRPVWWEHL